MGDLKFIKIKNVFLLLLSALLVASSVILIVWQNKRMSVMKTVSEMDCKDCNVVLISIDTLRADHISGMGYKRNTTPNLDKIIKTSLAFSNDTSSSSWTLPSTMSIFTGLLPSHHKIVNKYLLNNQKKEEEIANLSRVSPGVHTLAEFLKSNGYATGGFTGGAGVDKEFGFNNGFDTYFDENNFGGFTDSVPRALDWIKQNKDKKMFVFLHGYDVHGQYVPKSGYDRRFVDFNYTGNLNGSTEEQQKMREEGITNGQIYLTTDDVKFLIDLYDEKIQRADEILGTFFDEYQKLGLTGKTIFIITSDHGDEFYEHGQIDHGHSLYEELVHTPLFIKTPFTKGEKIDSPVSNIDIVPTILGMTKTKSEAKFDGLDLQKYLLNNDGKRNIFSETVYRYVTDQKSVKTANNWKLIDYKDVGIFELFNLKSDPGEKENMTVKKKNTTNALEDLINKSYLP